MAREMNAMERESLKKFNEVLEMSFFDVEEKTYWCDSCEEESTISKDTPWGTCLCS